MKCLRTQNCFIISLFVVICLRLTKFHICYSYQILQALQQYLQRTIESSALYYKGSDFYYLNSIHGKRPEVWS